MNINLAQAKKRRYSLFMKRRSTSKRGRVMTVWEFRASFGDERQCGEQLEQNQVSYTQRRFYE